MSGKGSYVAENNAQRERLRALVSRLGDDDLSRPLDAGWTIAAVLGHLIFWDQRTLVLIEGWKRAPQGSAPRNIDQHDVDWINDSAKALCLALPPRTAARLAIATAEAVDRAVEGLSDAQVAANDAAGRPLNLFRAEHRREHLDEIEHALAKKAGGTKT
jgi:hypothetical protein